ncbi:hypothetical protein MPSEU_000421100 [Mayamaea pseudoterrestris]|nr:hypothetical protein MPSEU_000421000 [Mayamaea pseudoterrestris]GKY94555.1 hypothetical protein MPSEU_000421100 [Mayamaea pseudoterrestris]
MRLTEKWSRPTIEFLALFYKKVIWLLEMDAEALTGLQRYDMLRDAFSEHTGFSASLAGFDGMIAIKKHMGQHDSEDNFAQLYAHLEECCIKYDKKHPSTTKTKRTINQAQSSGTKGGGGGNGGATPSGLSAERFAAIMKKPHASVKDEVWLEMKFDQRKQLKDKRATAPKTPENGWRPRNQRGTATTQTQVNAAHQERHATESVANDHASVPGTINIQPGNSGMSVQTAARSVLQANNASTTTQQVTGSLTTDNTGRGTFSFNMHRRMRVNRAHYERINEGALIDSGANGGLCGGDMLVVSETNAEVDVTGIDDHIVPALKIGTAAGLAKTLSGETILLLCHQYALKRDGPTIHCPNQLRAMGHRVDDIPTMFGGTQRITTNIGGYVLPLAIRDGLVYLDVTKPTFDDLDKYPTVIMTSDVPWDSTVYDVEHAHDDFDERDHDYGSFDERFDDDGITHRNRHTPTRTGDELDVLINRCVRHAQFSRVNLRKLRSKEPDYNALRPYLGWVPTERVQQTLRHTEAWYHLSAHPRLPFRHLTKSRFPAANVQRLRELFATDTIHSDTPALDDGILGHGGATKMQLFVGRESFYTRGYPMKSESEMSNALEDFIREVGAPNGLLSDNAKSETGKAVRDLCRMYNIPQVTTEPGHPEQNPCERHTSHIKPMMENLQRDSGSPGHCWVLLIKFVIMILNVLATKSLGWRTPTEVAFGNLPDISPLLHFKWWEPVTFEAQGSFPSAVRSGNGRFVGIAENSGPHMTFLVLTDDTLQAIPRSNVVSRSYLLPRELPSFPESGGEISEEATRASERNFETPDLATGRYHSTHVTESSHDNYEGNDDETIPMANHANVPAKFFRRAEQESGNKCPLFSPSELIGRTFVREHENGQKMRATVCEYIEVRDNELLETTKGFLIQMGEEPAKDLISYNELSDLIERQMDEDIRNDPATQWVFTKVIGHELNLKPNDPTYKGSSSNVLVEWTDGTTTWEPLAIMKKDDPITIAEYGLKHGLLDKPGWKQLEHYTRKRKKFRQMVTAAKRKSKANGVRYKFGVRLPRNYKDAKALDEINGNTLWTDAIRTELNQINDYDTFADQGVGKVMPAPWKRINVHMIFDVKHDLRRKARLVAGGHMTEPPKDSVYSGVVSLRSLRMVAMLAELNGLELWAADVGNAYLEAKTKEKVYIVAGPEFGELEGHTLTIVKALYGLRTSGARWHEHFADTLRDIGFMPCIAEPDVWMRDKGTHYEYVCVYVDDLAIAMKNPKELTDLLIENYNYKLKGVGPLAYHLGADVWRDDDGVLCFGAKKYVTRLLANYKEMFGEEPRPQTSPLRDGDHPELDETKELDDDGIAKYQSIIGALQWAVSLCRFDIHCAVMTMGRFRAAPRAGHLERLKHICGYLRRYPDGAIRFNVSIPTDERYATVDKMDWDYSVYGKICEELPWNMPTPRGKAVRMSTFEDANLYHDYTTGRAAMGMLHMLNGTVVDWFSKRQATVETATYGSEFVAARVSTEQIMDLRFTLRMLGVPLDGPSWMFGDNKSVTQSSNLPHSSLTKRHNALAFHRVREAIAAGIINFNHIMGTTNPADVLTKFLPRATASKHLKNLLFKESNY